MYFGDESLNFLKDELKGYGPVVLLNYGSGSVKRNGIYDQVVAILKEAGKTIVENPGVMTFEEGSFDVVLCMNGLHVFPNKDKAYSESLRTLKPGGELLACFYIAGEQKVADWLAKTVMTRMGWFTPPFDTANDVRQRLEPYYEILDFHVEGAMLYFKAQKR